MTMNQKKALYAFGSPDREAYGQPFLYAGRACSRSCRKAILPCNRKRNEHPDRRPLVSLYILQCPLKDGSISAL